MKTITTIDEFYKLDESKKEEVITELNKKICYYYVEYKVGSMHGSFCFFWSYNTSYTRVPTFEHIEMMKDRICDSLKLTSSMRYDIELRYTQAALSIKQIFEDPKKFGINSITI